MAKQFLSGDEAFAYGIRLARPHVISAYDLMLYPPIQSHRKR